MRRATVPHSGEDRDRLLQDLYEVEYAGMVRLAYTLVGSNEEAEEIVQESFVDVYRRVDEIGRPGGYLRTAVVSRCRSAMRRRRLIAMHPPDRPGDMPAEAGEMWDVLMKLSEDQRIAVVLRYYGGYRASEIAEIAAMRPATVRSHLRRALAVLKLELRS